MNRMFCNITPTVDILLKEQMGHLVDDGANSTADKNAVTFQMQLIEQRDTSNVIGLAELCFI